MAKEKTFVCWGCGNTFLLTHRFVVREREMCEPCGQKEIAEWNRLVNEPLQQVDLCR